jgi:hypothetical protein
MDVTKWRWGAIAAPSSSITQAVLPLFRTSFDIGPGFGQDRLPANLSAACQLDKQPCKRIADDAMEFCDWNHRNRKLSGVPDPMAHPANHLSNVRITVQ